MHLVIQSTLSLSPTVYDSQKIFLLEVLSL